MADSPTGPFLVTGATGNVGRPVCEHLLAAGAEVRAAVLDPADPGLPAGVEPVAFDFADPASHRRAVDGCAGVFLLRPPPISKVGPTLNALVDAAVAAGVGHVTFLSVAGAETNKVVPHHRVERRLIEGGDIGWTILRPGFFAQNLTTAYREDIRAGRIVVPAGDGRVAFVDAADLGEVAARTLLSPAAHAGRGLHLTGPRAWTFTEVAALVTEVLGRPVRYEPVSALGYARHLRGAGLPLAQIVVQTVLHVGLRRGDAADVDPLLAELLGRPASGLEDVVRREQARLT